MTDPTPAQPSQSTQKRRSIKTKILLALLVVSLAPLVLFAGLGRYAMNRMREHVRAELVRHAREDLAEAAKNQAAFASAMLDKVEGEARMVAFFTEALLRDPAAFGHTRSYSAAEKPDDPAAATVYALAPGVSLAAAQPELDLISNLDKLFLLIKTSDPNLEEIYYGAQSGIFRDYPWSPEEFDAFQFTIEPAFAQHLNEGGEVSAQLWQAFSDKGLALSRQAMVSPIEPGRRWVIRDDESDRVFSVRQDKTGLDVYSGYDPRLRPWYRAAVGRDSVSWTKFANWSGADYLLNGADLVFALDAKLESQIGDKVSPSLARAFEDSQIVLKKNSPISVAGDGKWQLQDANGSDYQISKEHGKLNVYSIDDLTCSRAVLDPEGRLAGVVGLSVNMASFRRVILGEFPGYSFLLNERGELMIQEKADMFIPEAGGVVRSKMTAGDTGIEYDADHATHVAYAPIRSIHSPDGKSFWSLGVTIPGAEMARLADDIQQRMFFALGLAAALFAAIAILVTLAAIRLSRGITGPIVALDAGVQRIGSGDLEYRVNVGTRDEIGDLADAFNKMAGDLQAYIKNLRDTTAEKERFESELRVAHDIQMSFLKKIFPAFPNRAEFSLYAEIKTAREVGGDLYDFALLDDSRLFFYIGDVSDKGVPASLIMAITMSLMKRASLQPGITPAGVLRQVNVTLSEGNENVMFVTLFIGILDLRTGELAFSNAGHNPPVILGANGECTFLTVPDGMVLGVMPETQYRDASVVLERRATIVIYTDGVTEAMNPARELYSEERLQETVAELKGRSVEDTVAAIFASVKAHAAGAPQSDDIAVLAVRRS